MCHYGCRHIATTKFTGGKEMTAIAEYAEKNSNELVKGLNDDIFYPAYTTKSKSNPNSIGESYQPSVKIIPINNYIGE